MRVPLMAPAFLAFVFAAPPTVGGLELRWRRLLGDGRAGWTMPDRRTNVVWLLRLFWGACSFAAPIAAFVEGR